MAVEAAILGKLPPPIFVLIILTLQLIEYWNCFITYTYPTQPIYPEWIWPTELNTT